MKNQSKSLLRRRAVSLIRWQRRWIVDVLEDELEMFRPPLKYYCLALAQVCMGVACSIFSWKVKMGKWVTRALFLDSELVAFR